MASLQKQADTTGDFGGFAAVSPLDFSICSKSQARQGEDGGAAGVPVEAAGLVASSMALAAASTSALGIGATTGSAGGAAVAARLATTAFGRSCATVNLVDGVGEVGAAGAVGARAATGTG
jgi:hypothetical protein